MGMRLVYTLASFPGHRAVWHGNEACVCAGIRLVYTLASFPDHRAVWHGNEASVCLGMRLALASVPGHS